MKTRTNYVSNSSSTSFVVYGRELDYYEALETMADDAKKVICILSGKGTSGDVEDFVFRMTNYRMNELEKAGIDINGMDATYLLAMKCGRNEVGSMDITEPLTGGMIFTFMKDYSSPNTDDDTDEKFANWVKWRTL